MEINGGDLQNWAPTRAAAVRTELAEGYRRIRHAMIDLPDRDPETCCGTLAETMLDGVARAIDEAVPTWLSADTVRTLRAAAAGPVSTDVLTAAGARGLVLFEEPVTRTTLGSAGPTGVSEVNGLAWWAAEFTGHAFDSDSPEPNLVVVHALSTNLSTEAPWSPALWSGSTLTDLGMFPLPLGTETTAPPQRLDDLGPAIGLLLGLGTAVCEQRVLFEEVRPRGGGSAAGEAVRTVAVLATA